MSCDTPPKKVTPPVPFRSMSHTMSTPTPVPNAEIINGFMCYTDAYGFMGSFRIQDISSMNER